MFNFFVNLDEALNSNNYEMFLYRAISENRVDFCKVSLREGMKFFFDRMAEKLNRDPFITGQYQVTGCMRETYREQPVWTETILYKELTLYYYMIQSGHNFRTYREQERCFNLIVLYEITETQLPGLENEYNMKKDMESLWSYLKFDFEALEDPDSRQRILSDDGIIQDEVTRFFLRSIIKEYDPDTEISVRNWADQWMKRLSFFRPVYKYVNRMNREENILAVFRILEFLYSGEEFSYKNFSKYWEKESRFYLEKYGKILYTYHERLKAQRQDLNVAQKRAEKLAIEGFRREAIPIQAEETFEQMIREYEESLDRCIAEVSRKKAVRAVEKWGETYHILKDLAGKIDKVLAKYARELKSQYFEQLEDYRQTESMRTLSVTDIRAMEVDRETLKKWEEEEQEIYEELRKPEIDRQLGVKDMLLMENVLEEINSEMQYQVRCLKAVKFRAFVFLFLMIGLAFAGHYTLLQYYVFTEAELLIYYGGYVAVVLLGFFACWSVPITLMRRSMRRLMHKLKTSVSKVLSGYKEQARRFTEYLNYMNKLETILSAKEKVKNLEKIQKNEERMRLWHRKVTEEHLEKLSNFDDFLRAYGEFDITYSDAGELDIHRDAVHNTVYWPMGRQKENPKEAEV